MECSEARRLLTQLCDGRLPLAQEQALARHLAHCASCRRAGAALQDVEALLDGAPPEAVPLELTGRVLTAVQRRARRERALRRGLIGILSVSLVVVGVVLPAMRVAQAAGADNAFAVALTQLAGQTFDLVRAVLAPLWVIGEAVLLGGGLKVIVVWTLVAVLLALTWAWAVTHAIHSRTGAAPGEPDDGSAAARPERGRA
ncbi:MAG: anti-sigma factor [Anaerolineales bacterium]